LADETIIMTPATTQSLPFESESNAGNTHENFRETFAVENFRRFGRLEDSVRTARELGAIVKASRYHGGRLDPRIENCASRSQRIGQDEIS